MAITFVQSRGSNGSGANPTLAYTSNNTAGNMLVAIWRSGVGSTATITDSQGNTWRRGASGIGNVTVWYALNCKAGANTVTLNQSNTFFELIIAEYSGLAASGIVIDVFAGSTGSSTTPASPSIVTVNANDLLLVGLSTSTTGETLSGIGSFTNRQGDGSGNSFLCDQIVSAAGTYSFSGTLSASTTWNVVIIAFRDVANTGGITGIIPIQGAQGGTGNTGNLAAQTALFPSANLAGDLLVAVIRAFSSVGQTLTSVTDTAGNTWVQGQSFIKDGGLYFLYYAANCKASNGNTVTFTFSAAISANISIAEYAGIALTNPVDQNSGNAQGVGTVATSNTVTTTKPNELILVWAGNETSVVVSITPGSGFVQRTNLNYFSPNTTNIGDCFIEDEIVTTTGSYSGSMTWSSSVSWAAGIITFIAQTQIVTHNADAVIQIGQDKAHNTDAVIQADQSKIHSADADIQADQSKTHNASAVIQIDGASVHFVDAFIQTQIEFQKIHSADAFILLIRMIILVPGYKTKRLITRNVACVTQ